MNKSLRGGRMLAVLLLGVAASLARAETPAADTVRAINFKDPKLQWGPCPAFIPKGCEIAVLHGDPSRKNADILFKVPSSFTIPNHWHHSPERMVLLSGALHVTYEGQKPFVLRPGDYAYGPAKQSHTARCAKGAACVLFIAFESPVDAYATEAPPPSATSRDALRPRHL